jgi:UDP-galactopyranose mutase
MTLYQVWGVKTPQEAAEKLQSCRIDISDPQNLEEWILSQVGSELYEIFIKGYTTKQWNTDPKNLPSSIIQRLPIRLKYDDNYFNDKYQGIPEDGYTGIIKNLIDGADVILETDYFENIDSYNQLCKHVIYTGPIDRFFNYEFGKLDYRSLRFEEQHLDIEDFQGNAIVNYTSKDIQHTRIIEHKHFNFINSKNTIISREYPQDFADTNEPYYPINNEQNNTIYEQYKAASKKLFPKIVFGGRLAEYKYYDMHQVIGSALHLSDKFFV